MARCEKCLMDPCLCGTPGFTNEDDESTTEKNINELIGRRVILKVTPEAAKFLENTLVDSADPRFKSYQDIVALEAVQDQIKHRLTDTTGKIDKIGGAKIGETYIAVFYIIYDNPINNDLPGHWYLDEELIYI